MNINKVQVRFRQNCNKNFTGKKYNYFSYEDLEIGDLVVVETIYGPSVAKVVDIVGNDESFTATSFVISKIDMSTLDDYKKLVNKALAIKEEADKEMSDFMSAYREAYYTGLSSQYKDENPVLAELLKEL